MSDRLNIDDMHKRHRALTQSIAGGYREATAVCLNRFHSSPTEITIIDNGVPSVAEISWSVPDERVAAAHANEIDATEAAAYGCVIAGVELRRGLFAIRRAETGTGADYYIGPQGSGDDLESCLRLEVSGSSNCTSNELSRRLVQKVQQTLEGNSNLPALAGVVGFSTRTMLIKEVGESS
jgi:hypothetical protein